jgi:hypothetical protein
MPAQSKEVEADKMKWKEGEDRWDRLEAEAQSIMRTIDDEKNSILDDEEVLRDAYLDFELEE